MTPKNGQLPRLVIFDGPGGPAPHWYLPRLTTDYDLYIVLLTSGNIEKDERRASVFEPACSDLIITEPADASQKLLGFGRKWKPDGILAFSELTITTVHSVALELGLPSNSPTSLRALRNKYEQRRLLAQASLPVPRFGTVRSCAGLRSAINVIGRPAVLKPAVGVGSMATYSVTAQTDLADLWAMAANSYEQDGRGTKQADFVVEQFLIGDNWHGDTRYGEYASVESIVQDGTATHLAVTDKFPLSAPFRENGGIMPSNLPAAKIENLMQCASDAIGAIGITNSAVHTELMLTANGPRVIEVNSRIGGGVTEMLHYSYGYDVIGAMAAVATGQPVKPRGPLLRSTAFCLPQAPADDTVITKAPNAEDLLALDVVADAQVLYGLHERPAWERGTAGGYVARVVAVSDSAEELLEFFDYLKNQAFVYGSST